jgi:hypothetical protein
VAGRLLVEKPSRHVGSHIYGINRALKLIMASNLSPSEAAQLSQTIEMFEVITQSQAHDYRSLEILKEAYSKLGREKEVINTSKRIAEAYVQMGRFLQPSEYETILARYPEDADVQAALQEIERQATPAARPHAGGPAAIVRPPDAGMGRRSRADRFPRMLMMGARRCSRFSSRAR